MEKAEVFEEMAKVMVNGATNEGSAAVMNAAVDACSKDGIKSRLKSKDV